MRKNILTIIILTCLVKNSATGQQWSTLGEGMANVPYYGEAWVNSIIIYNGEVYAGGVFDTAGGVAVNRIAKWNGSNWSSLGGGVILNGGPNGHVRTMIVYGGELYVGGYFDSAGGIAAKNIAKWNGTNWSAVGTGVNNVIIDFVEYNGELYAGGAFDTAGGVTANRIAKWNGTNWSPVGAGIDPDWYVNHPTSVYALAVNNGILYAGGAFDTAGTVPANNIAKWNGTTWSALSSGVSYGTIYSLIEYNAEIYAGGTFSYAGNIYTTGIAKWNGTNWSALGSGIGGDVYSMSVYHDVLYVGGGFWSAGDAPANNLAKWDGTYWSGVGAGINSNVYTLYSHDSSLYIGGHFTYADTLAANRIVKWTGNCLNPAQPAVIIGSDTICEGSTQTYFINAVNGATSYTWVLPMEWYGSSTTNSITINAGVGPAIISVLANNSCGNSPAQTLLITTVPSPYPDYINGNSLVCSGSTQTYFVNQVPGAISYSWNIPQGWSGNSTTDSITVTVGPNPGIISVVANYNCGSSFAQTLEVTIDSLPVQPGIITGSDSICQLTSHSYSVSPVTGATSYTWSLPAGWSGISDSNSITVEAGLNSGSISVVANNSCGSSIPQTIMITTESIPAMPVFINGNDTVCEGSSQTYFIDPVPGATGYAWDLTFGTAFGFNSTSITITPQYSGYPDDFITVLAYNNCGTSDMIWLPVKVNHLPYQPDRIYGNIRVCRGSSQTYFVDPLPGATSYTWIIPSGWIGNSNTSSINVNVGNETGQILVSANNSCGTGGFNSLQILLDTIPSKPGPIYGNTYVFAGEKHGYSVEITNRPSGYSWSLSGGGSVTAGQSPHKVEIDWQTPGTYVLSVNAVNSCGVSTEQKMNIIVAGANEKDPYSLQLFPNPSTGEFYLKAKRVQDKWISVEVLSMSGQLVFTSGKRSGANDYSQLIDLDKMSPGLYVARITVDEQVFNKKISIIK